MPSRTNTFYRISSTPISSWALRWFSRERLAEAPVVRFTAASNLSVSDIHGGIHVRMPIFKERPIVPYALRNGCFEASG